jgi:cytochrome bd-type quinol oxidase subunit 2
VPALIFGVAVGNVLLGRAFLPDRHLLYPIYDGGLFHAKFLGLLSPFALLCGRGLCGDAADPWCGLAGLKSDRA